MEDGSKETEDEPSGGTILSKINQVRFELLVIGVVPLGIVIEELSGFGPYYILWFVGFALLYLLERVFDISGTRVDNSLTLSETEIDELVDQRESFVANRESYHAHLREDPLSLLQKDPRYTGTLLRSLAALETFFELERTADSVEEVFRIIDEDTLTAMLEYVPTESLTDALSSPRGQIITGFVELGLIDSSSDSASSLISSMAAAHGYEGEYESLEVDRYMGFVLDEEIVDRIRDVYTYDKAQEDVSLPFDRDALISFGVSSQEIPQERDLLSIGEDRLVALYDAVLAAAGKKAVPLDDETIAVFQAADFTLHEGGRVSLYSDVEHSKYDWDTLASFNETLRTVLDRASLPPFDEHFLTRLHEEIQQLLRDVRSPAFDGETVIFRPDIDLASIVSAEEISYIAERFLFGIVMNVGEDLTDVMYTLDYANDGLLRFEDVLSALGEFYSLRKRFDRNELTRAQFDRELSHLIERRTEEGRKQSAYLKETSSSRLGKIVRFS